MTLTSALANSLSGLRFNAQATALTSANIANAGTPSYTRKLIDPVDALAGDQIAGVKVGSIRREYDAFVQRQLVGEKSNAGYASTRSQFLSRLDQMMGTPGSARALDTVLNNLSSSFQTLLTSPESETARAGVVNAATVVTQTLRSLSTSTQDMRLDAEKGLADAASRLNTLLGDLSKVNSRLEVSFTDESRVGLLDQRDALVTQISEYTNVRTVYQDSGAVQLYGGAGFVLLSTTKPDLSFDARDLIGPSNAYDTDPAKRTVGTIMADTPSGKMDLIAAGVFTSGKIAALIDLRDKTLPAAQSQLDQIAAGLAQALGTQSSSSAVTSTSTMQGFDTPLGPGLSDGDTVTMELTVMGRTKKFTFKRIDDGTVPATNSMSADPNDEVIRLPGPAASNDVAAMQTAVNAWANSLAAPAGSFTVTLSPSPQPFGIRVVADPSLAGGAKVGSATANVTARTLTDGGAALPFFVDATAANGLYSDRYTAGGAQFVGLAARIDVNAGLKADPSSLVKLSATTLESDETRPSFLVKALADTGRYFRPAGGSAPTAILSRGRSCPIPAR